MLELPAAVATRVEIAAEQRGFSVTRWAVGAGPKLTALKVIRLNRQPLPQVPPSEPTSLGTGTPARTAFGFHGVARRGNVVNNAMGLPACTRWCRRGAGEATELTTDVASGVLSWGDGRCPDAKW